MECNMRGYTWVAGMAAGLLVAAPGWSQTAEVGRAATAAESPGAMNRLTAAADRLREAVQAMATQPAGERRNFAIRQADEALLEVKQAMTSLPPDLRGGSGAAVGATRSEAPAASAGYSDSMVNLQSAAQRLRESIQTMASEPAGDRRDMAIAATHAALRDTEQAMVSLPPDLRRP